MEIYILLSQDGDGYFCGFMGAFSSLDKIVESLKENTEAYQAKILAAHGLVVYHSPDHEDNPIQIGYWDNGDFNEVLAVLPVKMDSII